MSRSKRLMRRILDPGSDAGVGFDDLRGLLRTLGFAERTKGSHHIFTKEEVTEMLNLQRDNGHAKPDQGRQVRGVIQKYKLGRDL